jgi:excisionase family DNA binding protein
MKERISFDELPDRVLQIESQLNSVLRYIRDPDNAPDRILSIHELSELTGWAVPTIYGKVHRREIPHFKRGKNLMFSRKAIKEWLDEGRVPTVKEVEEVV